MTVNATSLALWAVVVWDGRRWVQASQAQTDRRMAEAVRDSMRVGVPQNDYRIVRVSGRMPQARKRA